MCGRYSIATDTEQLVARFETSLPVEPVEAHYNAAPTQTLPVILNEEERRIERLVWGLVPHWAKDPAIGARMINARAETVRQKPSYREAFHKRRCLVLADGFFEWQRTSSGKVPMRFTLESGEPFAFAGLWETWRAPDGAMIRTFTIITTTPNPLVAPVHDRMPAMLRPEHERLWLDNSAGPDDWYAVLEPYPADQMKAYAVSARVNSAAHNDPSVLEPA